MERKSNEVEGKEWLNISLEDTEVPLLEAEEKSPSREKSTLWKKSEIRKLCKRSLLRWNRFKFSVASGITSSWKYYCAIRKSQNHHRWNYSNWLDSSNVLRSPFTVTLQQFCDTDLAKDEFLDLHNIEKFHSDYESVKLDRFWGNLCEVCHSTTKRAYEVLVPFVATYLCKSIARNELKAEYHTRAAVENVARNWNVYC